MLVFLSLGWGVQSFTLACMIALGELPMVDLAIHADTTHESLETYRHARKWTPWLAERGLRVETVRPPDSRALREDWSNSVMVPAYTKDMSTGERGQLRRQCTHDWKIVPIRKRVRELLGNRKLPPESVHCWQGISLDEFSRMRTSDVRYIRNVYPLVDMRMSRAACVQWLQERGLEVPPKSACVFCPYHSGQQWRNLKARGGPDWEHAAAVDESIRDRRPGYRIYVNNRLMPLERAVRVPEDEGARQLELEVPCDGGVCFV